MPNDTIKQLSDLTSIAAKDPALCEGVSKAALTVYSLYWLHEWEIRRTIEAVSVLNCRLFPNEFSMVSFREFPDALRTNRSLLQGQPKYRNWLSGSATKGFHLNTRGQELAEELIRKLGCPETESGTPVSWASSSKLPTRGPARTIEPEREVAQARKSRLFERWKEGELGERDLIHVHSILGMFDHTPKKVRRQKLKSLETCAKELNDTEFLRFLIDVRTTFMATFNG